MLAKITDRPGANDAGTDLASAREVADGTTVTGNLRGEEFGHTYAVWLDPGQSVDLSGTFTASESTGTHVRVDVYDDQDALVQQRLLQAPPYGTDTAEGAFTSPSTSRARFVFHLVDEIPGARWELLDYALTFDVVP